MRIATLLSVSLTIIALQLLFSDTTTNQLYAQYPKEAFDSISLDQALPLSGTEQLSVTSDIASDLVDGVDRFLLKQIAESVRTRQSNWPKPEKPATENSTLSDNLGLSYTQAIEPLRQDFARRIGLVDQRISPEEWIVESPIVLPSQKLAVDTAIASDDSLKVMRVRWPVLDGWEANGLLLVPKEIRFGAVLVPDAEHLPEQLCGLSDNSTSDGLLLARAGGLVVIPQVASRHREARSGRAVMTDQEFLYRSAFILGRHLLGYHVQQNRSAIDLLVKSVGDKPILVAGWGEGGWIALATGAVDSRVQHTIVSGHFGPRENVWNEPIHRNVHGLLKSFGDAQLAALVAPRNLWIDPVAGPVVSIGGDGGAPGELKGPTPMESRNEAKLAQNLLAEWKLDSSIHWIENAVSSAGGQISDQVIGRFLSDISATPVNAKEPHAKELHAIELNAKELGAYRKPLQGADKKDAIATPSDRLQWLKRLDRWQQQTLDLIQYERDAYWKGLDTSSAEKFQTSIEPYRKEFRDEVIGAWEIEKQALRPRTRLVYEREKWRGYEVVLDVFDEVIAYGVLLVPKSDKPISNRPCVVFQHGLEGRPTDTIVKDHPAYHDVSTKLAEEGYVVFAPQNLYLFTDRFRSLQRKSNPLGKTLFSTIIAQHEQIVRWLASRPEIDPNRIAFYGLSYGGKSAMRIPALVPEYCLSICSADFNDWVWKNASTSSPYSYVWTMEYEIFEFDLGRKFNYAEMATLIAPRPFMVERGHADGVAPDERVGLEFAKVRRMYAAKLGIPEKTEIEWFNGPHTIHGVGTFEFLKKHLKPEWMEKSEGR